MNPFANLIRPAPTVLDYMGQMEELDSRAVQRQAMQAQLAETQRKIQQADQERNALSELLRQSGGDQNRFVSLLEQSGVPSFYQQAQGYRKAMLDAQKTQAGIAKDTASARKTGIEADQTGRADAISQLQMLRTPDDARASLSEAVTAGRMSMQDAQRMMQMIPPDAQGFAAWKEQMLTAALDPAKAAEMRQKLADAQQRARNDLVGPDGRPNQSVIDAKAAIARAGASNISMGLGSPVAITGPDGQPMLVQPPTKAGGAAQIVKVDGLPVRPAAADKAMTEGQAKANLFGTRAQEADKIIAALPSTKLSIAQQATGGEGMLGVAATAMASPEQQQLDQAQRDFINAVLRRESGAVISPQEFANARKQYFAMPGDSPQVLAQKARNRQTAIGGILAEVPDAKRGVPAASPPAPAGLPSMDAIEAELRRRQGK